MAARQELPNNLPSVITDRRLLALRENLIVAGRSIDKAGLPLEPEVITLIENTWGPIISTTLIRGTCFPLMGGENRDPFFWDKTGELARGTLDRAIADKVLKVWGESSEALSIQDPRIFPRLIVTNFELMAKISVAVAALHSNLLGTSDPQGVNSCVGKLADCLDERTRVTPDIPQGNFWSKLVTFFGQPTDRVGIIPQILAATGDVVKEDIVKAMLAKYAWCLAALTTAKGVFKEGAVAVNQIVESEVGPTNNRIQLEAKKLAVLEADWTQATSQRILAAGQLSTLEGTLGQNQERAASSQVLADSTRKSTRAFIDLCQAQIPMDALVASLQMAARRSELYGIGLDSVRRNILALTYAAFGPLELWQRVSQKTILSVALVAHAQQESERQRLLGGFEKAMDQTTTDLIRHLQLAV